MSWQMSQTDLPGHIQHLTSSQAESLQNLLAIRANFDYSTAESMVSTVLNPLVKYFPDARAFAKKHKTDANVIYYNWDENHPLHGHVGRSTGGRLHDYFAAGTEKNKEAVAQLRPSGCNSSPNVRGIVLLNFSGDELHANTDYPVAACVAVENVEAIFTMLLTPPTGLEGCPGMRVHGGKRQLPDDANFADRLDKTVAKLKSGVFVSMKKAEFDTHRTFMSNLSKGQENLNIWRPLSAVRQKLVDDAGLAALYSNLQMERARHQNLQRDKDSFSNYFYRLVEWLSKNYYKYPAQVSKNEHERELGRWVNSVRKANNGSGTMMLDARRRAHLDAINFAWEGTKGNSGTRSKFPANWADQIGDEIFEL